MKNHVLKSPLAHSPASSVGSGGSDEGMLTEKNVNNIVKRKRKSKRKVDDEE